MAIETNPSTPISVTPGSGSSTNVEPISQKQASDYSSTLNLNTQGWWMFAGITTAILLGNTPIAPFAFGILTVALIYQTGLLLEGK